MMIESLIWRILDEKLAIQMGLNFKVFDSIRIGLLVDQGYSIGVELQGDAICGDKGLIGHTNISTNNGLGFNENVAIEFIRAR